MIDYDDVRQLHMSLAVLSIAGFIVRGVWSLLESPLLRRRWVRIAPHVLDSLLLSVGVGLMVSSYQWPTVHLWLAAKLSALLVYIALGLVTLRFARSLAGRSIAFCLAILVFGYMLAVAFTRNPLPWQ